MCKEFIIGTEEDEGSTPSRSTSNFKLLFMIITFIILSNIFCFIFGSALLVVGIVLTNEVPFWESLLFKLFGIVGILFPIFLFILYLFQFR